MNTIILYASKYECTAECAASLQAALPGGASLTDIQKTDPGTLALEGFDTIILGSPVYAGSIPKKMRAFCRDAIDVLCRKKVGIFLCCAQPSGMEEYLAANFPAALLEKAAVIGDFGGEARMDKMKGIDKLILKAATKGAHESLQISRANMEDFIKAIRA